MKRYLLAIMVLALCGVSFGFFPMDSSTTGPIVPVCMHSTTTGQRAPGLTVTNFSVKYRLSTGLMSAALTGELETGKASWSEPNSTKVGVYEEITASSTGIGTYVLHLPAAFMTNAVSGQFRTVSVIDSVGGAEATWLVIFNPPGNTVQANYTTLPSWNPNSDPIVLPTVAPTDWLGADGVAASAATKIAAATWDKRVADHKTSGTFGLQVGSGSQGTPPPSIGQASIWSGFIDSATTNTVVLNTTTPTPASTNGAYAGYMLTWDLDSSLDVACSEFHPILGYVASTRTVTIAGTFVGTPAVNDHFSIIPSGISPDNFGPNAALAVLEKSGSGAGTTLSTNSTIYLTANTLDTILYAPGMIVMFADSAGIYHYGKIFSNTSDVLVLSPPSTGTPADLTPIYSLGKYPSYFADELATALHYGTYGDEATGSVSTRNAIYVDHVTSTDDSFVPGTIVLVETTGGPAAPFECIVVKDYAIATNKITPYCSMKYAPLAEGRIYVQEHIVFPYFTVEQIVKENSKQGF
jgi:hypothetical protein